MLLAFWLLSPKSCNRLVLRSFAIYIFFIYRYLIVFYPGSMPVFLRHIFLSGCVLWYGRSASIPYVRSDHGMKSGECGDDTFMSLPLSLYLGVDFERSFLFFFAFIAMFSEGLIEILFPICLVLMKIVRCAGTDQDVHRANYPKARDGSLRGGEYISLTISYSRGIRTYKSKSTQRNCQPLLAFLFL